MVKETRSHVFISFSITNSAGCRADPMVANLPSSQLTASDSVDHHNPSRSKLNTQGAGEDSDCWKPQQSTVVDGSYIQVRVDFALVEHNLESFHSFAEITVTINTYL